VLGLCGNAAVNEHIQPPGAQEGRVKKVGPAVGVGLHQESDLRNVDKENPPDKRINEQKDQVQCGECGLRSSAGK
jgi:hypothetical protein